MCEAPEVPSTRAVGGRVPIAVKATVEPDRRSPFHGVHPLLLLKGYSNEGKHRTIRPVACRSVVTRSDQSFFGQNRQMRPIAVGDAPSGDAQEGQPVMLETQTAIHIHRPESQVWVGPGAELSQIHGFVADVLIPTLVTGRPAIPPLPRQVDLTDSPASVEERIPVGGAESAHEGAGREAWQMVQDDTTPPQILAMPEKGWPRPSSKIRSVTGPISPDIEILRDRILRAGEIRAEIGRVWSDYLGRNPRRFGLVRSEDDPELWTFVISTVDPLPDRLSTLFGEWLSVLRAARDGTAYHLAVRDSGQRPPPNERNIYFPIKLDPAKHDSQGHRDNLKALSDATFADLRTVQPFNAQLDHLADALWWVEELASIDGHRGGRALAAHIVSVRVGLREPLTLVTGYLPQLATRRRPIDEAVRMPILDLQAPADVDEAVVRETHGHQQRRRERPRCHRMGRNRLQARGR